MALPALVRIVSDLLREAPGNQFSNSGLSGSIGELQDETVFKSFLIRLWLVQSFNRLAAGDGRDIKSQVWFFDFGRIVSRNRMPM